MARIFSIPDEMCGLPKRITITFRLRSDAALNAPKAGTHRPARPTGNKRQTAREARPNRASVLRV
jgi:hypothetical protein